MKDKMAMENFNSEDSETSSTGEVSKENKSAILKQIAEQLSQANEIRNRGEKEKDGMLASHVKRCEVT